MGQTRPINLAGLTQQHGPRFLVVVAVLCALLVRLPAISERPVHTDEAVNAFILEEMFERGYQYRAHDHHGPTLYLFSGAFFKLAGVTRAAQMEAWMLRLFPVACGAALAGAVYLLRPYIPRPAALAAAALLALAAPFAYYSGAYIHEMLFMLLLALFVAAFWRLHAAGAKRWAVAAGLFAGLMLGTKETAAIILPIVGGAIAAVHMFGPADPARPAETGSRGSLLTGYAMAVLTALAVTLLVYSNFLRAPGHAFDLFRAVGPQVNRGLGREHAYPWHTYFGWAFGATKAGVPWSAWLLTGFAVLGVATHPRDRLALALTGSAAGLLLAFSFLPYKTPWLMLAWMLPLTIAAGYGFHALARWHRFALPAVLLPVLGLLGRETYARCYQRPVDPGNPLAYSPTSPDAARIERDLAEMAKTQPEGRAFTIHVVAHDYWPLPWYLRHFPKTGYWSDPPANGNPSVVFCGPEHLDHYATTGELRPYELRPGVFIFLRQVAAPAAP